MLLRLAPPHATTAAAKACAARRTLSVQFTVARAPVRWKMHALQMDGDGQFDVTAPKIGFIVHPGRARSSRCPKR